MGLFRGRLGVKLGRDLGKDKAWSIAHAPIERGKAQWHISVMLSFRERRESGAS